MIYIIFAVVLVVFCVGNAISTTMARLSCDVETTAEIVDVDISHEKSYIQQDGYNGHGESKNVTYIYYVGDTPHTVHEKGVPELYKLGIGEHIPVKYSSKNPYMYHRPGTSWRIVVWWIATIGSLIFALLIAAGAVEGMLPILL